jgi:cytochrome c
MYRLTERSRRALLASLVLALLTGGSRAEPAGQNVVASESVQANQIGSTAEAVGLFTDIEERSLSFSHSLDAAKAGYYGLGETATPEMIAGWDIDVRPDGQGLPPGSGTAEMGEPLYEEKCAECHGVFGEGAGRWPKLAGNEPLVGAGRPEKTIGNYWPYASTLWDYIHRAMPFMQPQSLSDSEVYAITAYVLYLNEIIEYDQELNQDNLATIAMPNRDGFFADPRPDTENIACMEGCKDPDTIKITWDSTSLGVTPVEHLQQSQDSPSGSGPVNGERVYAQACALCHDSGLGGAPASGDKAAWAGRIAQGREMLIEHAINGFQGETGVMPPKGGQAQLSGDAVSAAVDYMLGLVGEG